MINWRQLVVNNNNQNFELGLIWSKGNSLQQIASDIIKIIKN